VRLATSTFQIIQGGYLRDILDQPRALAATLEQLEISPELATLVARLRSGKIRRVLLTGMGASFHALHPLFLRLNTCAYTALPVETSELIHSLQGWFEPQTLIIAVSQSGQSAEVVRLIEENRGRAAIVGVTNAADSPLAHSANALILTKAGEESSVSCKTYLTVLMALHLLGGFLCGCDVSRTREELAQILPAAAFYLRGWKDHVFEMAKELAQVRHIFLLGRGSSLAAAGEGALIVKESVRLYAEGMSGAAFRHGPLEMVSAETFAVLFAGAEATRALQAKLREDILGAGGKTAWIIQDSGLGPWNVPPTPASVGPILEILPVQMMTLALAANANVEAGRFTRIPKITTTE
jgi:glutamine---fructose-6-phosphate transaminase (isomerizing)